MHTWSLFCNGVTCYGLLVFLLALKPFDCIILWRWLSTIFNEEPEESFFFFLTHILSSSIISNLTTFTRGSDSWFKTHISKMGPVSVYFGILDVGAHVDVLHT